jgi:hypothetical protein
MTLRVSQTVIILENVIIKEFEGELENEIIICWIYNSFFDRVFKCDIEYLNNLCNRKL